MDYSKNMSKLSDDLTQIAFNFYLKKNNKMGIYSLLLGRGNFIIEAFPGAGHNYYQVLNSIYKYAEEHSELDVGKILEDVFEICVRTVSSLEHYSMIINYVVTQLENEKKAVAPFSINIIEILKKLKVAISADENLKNDAMFVQYANKTEKYIEEKYNKRV